MRTTAGSSGGLRQRQTADDATMVAKLRAAGAIILGKTNIDEYAPAGIARSAFGGQTCNPYDTKRIPGGSSAGSAAAVAANLAICALGTDTSGSVRFPRRSQSGRHGRDPGTGEPRRHRAAVVLPAIAAARSAAPSKTRRSCWKCSPATIPRIRSRRLAPRSPVAYAQFRQWKIAARKKSGRGA